MAIPPFRSNDQLSSEQTFHQSFRFVRRRKYLCRNLVLQYFRNGKRLVLGTLTLSYSFAVALRDTLNLKYVR